MKLRNSRALLAILAVGLQAAPLLADELGQDPLCSPPNPEVVWVSVTGLSGGVARLTWSRQPDYRIDIVRGDLAVLAATLGDYAQAVEMCLADDVQGGEYGVDMFDDADVPDLGQLYWYLLRTDRIGFGCGYGATGYSSLRGCHDVDIEIQNSGHDCFTIDPCQIL